MDWDKIDPAPKAAASQPTAHDTAAWDQYDRASAATPPTADSPTDWGAAKNFLTGLLRIPGAVIGTPALLEHTKNWADAKVQNGISSLVSAAGGSPLPDATGASIDKTDPIYQSLPTSEGVDKRVFGTLGTTPYAPTSTLGKVGQAATTAGGAALLDPAADLALVKQAPTVGKAIWQYLKAAAPQMTKNAAAGGVAEGTQQVLPDTPGLAALAALVTHSGLGVGAGVAKKGYRTFAEPIIDPKSAGAADAGANLTGIDNRQPGMAIPDLADLSAAKANTQKSVDAIGLGLDDYDAGGNIRSDLQSRKNALLAGRSSLADDAYAAFRAEQPLEGAKLGPFMGRPSFRAAVKAASGDVLDEGGKPLTDFWDFNEAGDPKLRPNAAVPPDVLDRVKGKLDDAVNAAPAGSRTQRTAGILRDQFRDLLDREYASTYPKTRADFAAASRPLDPLETGAPAKVLDGEKRFGNTIYSMPQDKIAGTFLKSQATRSDFDQLVQAYGGDKKAALSNLEQNLASKVQGAVNSDGTLSLDAYNKSIRPYTKSLGMWFPELSQKFGSAVAAQKTLETLHAQKALGDDIAQGGMRDSNGVITQTSAMKWLLKNEKALGQTQSKGAVMRMKQIANSLSNAPGAGVEAAIESAPMVIGAGLAGATGGASTALEGGVLGGITHKIPSYLLGPRMDAYRNAYSAAIEKAFSDPMEAQRLVTLAAKRGGNTSIRDLITQQALAAARAAPIATNAAGPP